MLTRRLIIAALLTAAIARMACAALTLPEEVRLPAGHYYVGPVFGDQDYRAHANATLTDFAVMKTDVTYAFYQSLTQWALDHGYELSEGCNGAVDEDCQAADMDGGRHPVTSLTWWEAVIFANAYSEYQRLTPYYLSSSGLPLKVTPEDGIVRRAGAGAPGYRLPSQAEWQVAARGGEQGFLSHTYGAPYSGSDTAETVANFPPARASTSAPWIAFATQPVASRQPNAAGLYDMSGNAAEWLDEPYVFEREPVMYFYCGGSHLDRVATLAACDMHTPGFLTPDTGFRLVRSLYD